MRKPVGHVVAAPSGRREPTDIKAISILGVAYVRLETADGSDLWLTPFGLQVREHLIPENWHEPEWFAAQRQRLQGTSSIYRLATKPVNGTSLNIVVRFSRVGEEIPLDTADVSQFGHVEFNSPFEEFALAMALRSAHSGPPRVLTKKPLAIFAPAERLEIWQTGRREYLFAQRQARHPEADMDISRRYILIYGWIKGMNAVQAAEAIGLADKEKRAFLADVTRKAIHDLERKGFRMLDIKPEHIIVRVRSDGALLRRLDGHIAYALVDYELLKRFTRKDTLHVAQEGENDAR